MQVRTCDDDLAKFERERGETEQPFYVAQPCTFCPLPARAGRNFRCKTSENTPLTSSPSVPHSTGIASTRNVST